MNKNFVTIGIPAYNEGTNAASLVMSLLAQKTKHCQISKIIVISDGSKDLTAKHVKSIKSKKVILIDDPVNRGLANRQNQIFSLAKTDIAVILNADIKINDEYFIEQLCLPIVESQADLTSGKITELRQNTIFEKSLWASMKIKDFVFESFNYGNNVYKCHGPVRAFSKKLYKSIKYKISEGEDMYTYLYTVKNKMKFKYVKEAIAFYRLPDNIKDHLKQSARFHVAIELSKREFGNLVEKSFNVPLKFYIFAIIKNFMFVLKNLHLLFIYSVAILLIKLGIAQKFIKSYQWDVRSSKKL